MFVTTSKLLICFASSGVQSTALIGPDPRATRPRLGRSRSDAMAAQNVERG
jgi:hypothetical protein